MFGRKKKKERKMMGRRGKNIEDESFEALKRNESRRLDTNQAQVLMKALATNSFRWVSSACKDLGARLETAADSLDNFFEQSSASTDTSFPEPLHLASTSLIGVLVALLFYFLYRRRNKVRADQTPPAFDETEYEGRVKLPKDEQDATGDEYGTLRETKIPHQWKNFGKALYIEAFGQDAWDTNTKSELAPCPSMYSLWDSLVLSLAIFRIKVLMSLGAFLNRARPTHTRGPGAQGDCLFLNNPDIPKNPFFSRLTLCAVRVRHSNALGIHNHDAGYEPRGMSIKFDDAEETAQMDLLLNTGECMGFFNLPSFWEFTASVTIGGTNAAQEEFAKKYPRAVLAGIGGFRRAPNSFADLHYYSQIPFEYKCVDDDIKRFCKIRAVPLANSARSSRLKRMRSSMKSGVGADSSRSRGSTFALDGSRRSLSSGSGSEHQGVRSRHSIVTATPTARIDEEADEEDMAQALRAAKMFVFEPVTNDDDDSEGGIYASGQFSGRSEKFLEASAEVLKQFKDTKIENELSGLPDLVDQRASVTLNTANFGKPSHRKEDPYKQDERYLTKEFHNRLGGERGVQYRLQIQIRELDHDADDHEMFNPNIAWDQTKYPFHDVAVITLYQSLEQQQVNDMRFFVGRLPPRSLALLPAYSVSDYNSIAYTRSKIYGASQYFRGFRRNLRVVNDTPDETQFVNQHPKLMKYEITTRTGTDLLASTYDVIKISFLGTGGQSSYMLLENNFLQNRFDAGKESTFKVVAQNVGELLAVKLEKQDRTKILASEWQIEALQVKQVPLDATYAQIRKMKAIKFLAAHWIGEQNPWFLRLDIDEVIPNYFSEANELRERRIRTMKSQWPWNQNDPAGPELPLRADYDNEDDLPADFQFRKKVLATLGVSLALGTFGSVTALGLAEWLQHFTQVDRDLVRKINTPLADKKEHHSVDWFRLLFLSSFSPFRLPERANRWRDDAEFADRFVSGANPLYIQGVDQIPKKMNITEEMTIPTLSKIDETLSSMLKKKKIFYIDYSYILDDIPTFTTQIAERINNSKSKHRNIQVDERDRFVAKAQALFYEHPPNEENGNKSRLMPLAIQLYPEKDAVVFLPSDDKYAWLTAKIHFMCADAQVHQFIGHLFSTHLLVEPMVVAKNRNLPPVHPVSRVLHHHTQGVCAINTLGRKILVGDGGLADEVLSIGGGGHLKIMERYYKHGMDGNGKLEFLKHFNHVEWTKMRNVEKSRLDFYPYRDDGEDIWKAIKKYVEAFLSLHYADDSNDGNNDDDEMDTKPFVWNDLLLSHWLGEMKHALPHIILPESFDKRETLVDFVTCLIFRLSCGHASVNFCQYDHYAHVPTAPMCLLRPPPKTKDDITGNHILDMLPPKSMMKTTLINLNNLTSFAFDEKFLSQYFCDIFTQEELNLVNDFQNDMDDIDKMMAKRYNEAKRNGIRVSGDAYHYLRPTRVPNGINI